MHDRIPLYPGRVKLTPVSGEQDTYDMVRADQPQREGTPLNKATLLTDEVAREYGLDDNATPNDIFRATSILFNGLGNQHLWEKVRPIDEVVDASRVTIMPSAMSKGRLSTSDSFTIVNGEFVLTNPTNIELTPSNVLQFETLVKKYFFYKMDDATGTGYLTSSKTMSEVTASTVYTPTSLAANNALYIDGLKSHTASQELVGYVNSVNKDAYPVEDGHYYIYLGQFANLGGRHGSYRGTGTYGSTNANTLSFDFPVNCVIISHNGAASPGVLIRGNGSTSSLTIVWGQNDVSWYSTSSAVNQLNSIATYNYMAW